MGRALRVEFIAALLALSCTKGSHSRSVDSELLCNTLPNDNDTGGTRKRSEIKRKVAEHVDELEACYQRALRHDPSAAGRVETRFVIGSDGAVTSACIQKTTLEDGDALECMLDRFRALRFGPNKGTMTVIYPLTYSPG